VRILHSLAAGEVGGLERVVCSLASGHRALGHQVSVAVVLGPTPTEHPFVRALSDRGLDVVPIHVAPRGYLAERAEIAGLCRRLQPDVFHTHGFRPDVVDAGVARRLGIPTVTTVHGFTGGGWKDRLYERVQRRAFRTFSAVVAVSQPLREGLVRYGVRQDRVHLIRNAWDDTVPFLDRESARRALGVPPEGIRVGWVGRISSEKGLDVMLDALGLLADTAITLSVLGDGHARGGMEARAAGLGIGGRVMWHGTVHEAARVISAFDVFVLSSRTEGTSIALFEAIAAGVPVVASAVGGVPDVVSPAEAMLVPSDDPAALAAAVTETLENAAAALERARAARRRLEREFALQPWLERYEVLYRALHPPRAALVEQ
jgi:glycosyltransferase involved in cell wall biosynthesis